MTRNLKNDSEPYPLILGFSVFLLQILICDNSSINLLQPSNFPSLRLTFSLFVIVIIESHQICQYSENTNSKIYSFIMSPMIVNIL